MSKCADMREAMQQLLASELHHHRQIYIRAHTCEDAYQVDIETYITFHIAHI